MSGENDGGPAFPRAAGQTERGFNRPQDGMTLRDWFAGQALAGICSNSYTPWAPDQADITDEELARATYELADAMLAARKTSTGQ